MDLGPDFFATCAPSVAHQTMVAIARAESGGNPLAIGINGDVRLARQPSTVEEAVAWATWLIDQGYSIDLGLMQINSQNLGWLQLDITAAFDPCTSATAGATVLIEAYRRALQELPPGQDALRAALRAYNTGKLYETPRGNRYVLRIENHLP
jgi:type IV secretion system protein VirB1